MQTVIIKEDNRLKLARTDIVEWKTDKDWNVGDARPLPPFPGKAEAERRWGYIYTLTAMTVNKNPVPITTTTSEAIARACEEELERAACEGRAAVFNNGQPAYRP